jgi:uncharacterized membrane protein
MLGVFVAVLHPLLSDGLASIGAPEALRVLLIDANKNLAWGGVQYIVSYPILPWFAVMAAGYGLGALIRVRPSDWSSLFARLGLVLTFCFVALRATGMGLDPEPWQSDLGGVRSVLSFLNSEKYPPSPLYLMMTLGPLLLLLALFERRGAGPAERILSSFGRAPLFFYVLHLYVLRSFGLAAAALVWGVGNLGPPPQHSAPEWPLWSAWVVWVLQFWPYTARRAGSPISRLGQANGGGPISSALTQTEDSQGAQFVRFCGSGPNRQHHHRL